MTNTREQILALAEGNKLLFTDTAGVLHITGYQHPDWIFERLEAFYHAARKPLEEAITNACMKTEGCLVKNDPAQTLLNLEQYWWNSGAEHEQCVKETSLILELRQHLAEKESVIEQLRDSQIDKLLAMTDEQVTALCRLEGSNPDDSARIAKQAMKLAAANVELAAANARIAELEAQAVPEGWKLVPIEPTEEMVAAGNIGQGFSRWALKAAIEAAPQAVHEWRPIETLPEGARFLSVTRLSNGAFGQVGISHSFYSHIVNNRGWKIAGDDPHATLWMPLPATPSPNDLEGEKKP